LELGDSEARSLRMGFVVETDEAASRDRTLAGRDVLHGGAIWNGRPLACCRLSDDQPRLVTQRTIFETDRRRRASESPRLRKETRSVFPYDGRRSCWWIEKPKRNLTPSA